jgi:hypothetical protein
LRVDATRDLKVGDDHPVVWPDGRRTNGVIVRVSPIDDAWVEIAVDYTAESPDDPEDWKD